MSSQRREWIASRVAQTYGLTPERVAKDMFSGEDGQRVDSFLAGNNAFTKIFVHYQPKGSVNASIKDLSQVRSRDRFRR
jgi:hypothetical protein